MELDQARYYPRVLQAMAGDGYEVYAYLSDGSVRLLNMREAVMKKPVFSPLKDYAVFTGALTIMNETVAWDISGTRDSSKCIDIDPFWVYSCPQVKDPLQEAKD